jgi:hypothetical protein
MKSRTARGQVYVKLKMPNSTFSTKQNFPRVKILVINPTIRQNQKRFQALEMTIAELFSLPEMLLLSELLSELLLLPLQAGLLLLDLLQLLHLVRSDDFSVIDDQAHSNAILASLLLKLLEVFVGAGDLLRVEVDLQLCVVDFVVVLALGGAEIDGHGCGACGHLGWSRSRKRGWGSFDTGLGAHVD